MTGLEKTFVVEACLKESSALLSSFRADERRRVCSDFIVAISSWLLLAQNVYSMFTDIYRFWVASL